ncbi:hypothetical protein NQ314_005248 [Rhamnusium bicolor]|uniref:Uncharacterized protein n=1 Tax=Rhamnusium bicolor TaxID=1586634 RepID=A0AAV8ZHH7_9CUCU|nr:hypothetical protein NQ314_005248 [Rhamnusium bicolor]
MSRFLSVTLPGNWILKNIKISFDQVTLTICAICLDLVKAKSDPAVRQDVKPKVSTKLNSISSTPKPDAQYQLPQQYQQQQHYQQQAQYPQQPLQPQLQRQLHAHPQILLQPQVQQALYQSQIQAQPQQHLMHVIQKAFYVPQQQNQPAAMIIIAQPTYVPAHLVQGTATQHLLNYFHNNPQARHQLLHGNYQQQPGQQVVQQSGQQIVQQPAGAHTIGNYQVVAVPAQYRQFAVPTQLSHPALLSQAVQQPSSEAVSQPSPLQLAQISQIASQQYARINPSSPQEQTSYPSQQFQYQPEANAQQSPQTQSAIPIRSLPPIITGFENFSPEQQEKNQSSA